MDTTRRTYSIEEAARMLGLGRSAAYAAAQRDQLPVPVLRIGRRLVVPRAPLDRLLDGDTAGQQRSPAA